MPESILASAHFELEDTTSSAAGLGALGSGSCTLAHWQRTPAFRFAVAAFVGVVAGQCYLDHWMSASQLGVPVHRLVLLLFVG